VSSRSNSGVPGNAYTVPRQPRGRQTSPPRPGPSTRSLPTFVGIVRFSAAGRQRGMLVDGDRELASSKRWNSQRRAFAGPGRVAMIYVSRRPTG